MKKEKGIERRKVEIPHYSLGGLIGGLFSGLSDDMTTKNQYQAQLAPTANSNFGGVIDQSGQNALAGYQTFQNNQGQQQNLANALQSVASGQGPNPAQAMLNQATGANVANQAALMAGQRGASANPGMIARQAALAGAGAQQQAAGQAATLQAQQSLGAMGQQGQILGQMGAQNIGEQGMNAGLFGNAAGAQNTQNANTISNYGMMQGMNQKTAQANADAVNKTMGGLMNGLGGGISMMVPKTPVPAAAKGGMMNAGGGFDSPHMKHMHSLYHSDSVAGQNSDVFQNNTNAIYRQRARDLGATNDMNVYSPEYQPREMAVGNYAGGGIADDFKGVQGKIGNWATDGKTAKQRDAERYNADPRNASIETALPGDMKGVAVSDFRNGGAVPGVAQVAGDSLKNDTQPAMLSPKEIVLPRSVTLAPDAPEKAKEFVEALLKKQGHGNSKHHKEFQKALREAILSRKKKSGE